MNRTMRRKAARGRKKALAYLRVSDPKQVKREFDPEGISLPQQRRSVRYKADELDAQIIEEFLEPGKSGKTVDKRPEFQRLLATIKERGDIDYVIVDSLSRANRNRYDDAIMMMMLRQAGVTVVSATENIDDTPAGQLLHGILAAVNEFRSNSDGRDVSRKMEQKARIGGTPGRAKIGYLNVTEKFEGRDVATVIVDDQRGPLVKLGFELMATGEYTLDTLHEVLVDAGLCALPRGDAPLQPICRSQVGRMLRDRYYIGYVTFKGVEYVGRHPHLVSDELFQRVQEVLDLHSGAGVRQRTHHHYLKGALRCHRCGCRVIYTVAKQTYPYFFCRGRQQGICDLPYLPVDAVEQAVLDHYQTIGFTPEFQTAVQAHLDNDLTSTSGNIVAVREKLTQQLAALSKKEDHYLDLVDDPAWPTDKIRDKMITIRDQRAKAQRALDALGSDVAVGRDILTKALVRQPHFDDLGW
jgi:site-specific DNA recombinase